MSACAAAYATERPAPECSKSVTVFGDPQLQLSSPAWMVYNNGEMVQGTGWWDVKANSFGNGSMYKNGRDGASCIIWNRVVDVKITRSTFISHW